MRSRWAAAWTTTEYHARRKAGPGACSATSSPRSSPRLASGKVYAFPEGYSGSFPLHRDVESLVYTLVEFRKHEVDHDNGADPEEVSAHFKESVGAFDPNPSPTRTPNGTSRWKSWNTASGNTEARGEATWKAFHQGGR